MQQPSEPNHVLPNENEPWHAMASEEVYRILNTTNEGLTQAEAANRLKLFGTNTLSQIRAKSGWQRFFDTIS
jgi:Ca2+-transporting ATPase